MNIKWILSFCGGIFVLFLLSGCRGGLPTCADDTLVVPQPASPAKDAVVDSLTPLFVWNYPEPNCNPKSYRITLYSGPSDAVELGADTGAPNLAWTPAAPLQPATAYTWVVQAANGTVLGPASVPQMFFTGPKCAPGSLSAPVLVYPNDKAVITDPINVILRWDYPFACVPDNYTIFTSVNEDMSGTGVIIDITGPQTWDRSKLFGYECRSVYWKVRAERGNVKIPGYEEASSEVRSYFVDTTGLCPGTKTPTPVVVPIGQSTGTRTSTPTPAVPNIGNETPTSTPVGPYFTLLVNAYCRYGPDIRYAKLESYPAGKSYPIIGKSQDGLWYFVGLTDLARCWFNASVGTASGDLSNLRTFYGPPLPTATAPILCSSYKTQSTCQANPTCKWVMGIAASQCVAK